MPKTKWEGVEDPTINIAYIAREELDINSSWSFAMVKYELSRPTGVVLPSNSSDIFGCPFYIHVSVGSINTADRNADKSFAFLGDNAWFGEFEFSRFCFKKYKCSIN